MTIPVGLEPYLRIDPEVMHGAVCFSGTRIPLSVLLDNLSEGMSVDDFLKCYPSLQRDQVMAVIQWEQEALRHAAGILRAS